jgi:hypothetical protein
VKSAFYLNEVNLDLETGAEGFGWSYEGSPARTDRAEQGFGRFTGRGRWSRAPAGGRVEIDLDLERSAASEVLTLVTGRDLGLQGRLTSKTRLTGPLHAVAVLGEVRVEGLDTRGLFGWRGAGWRIPYQGRLDLTAQKLELSTPDDPKTRAPLAMRFSASEFLRAPDWRLDLGLEALPAATLLALSRRFGVHAPEDLRVDGKVDGRVSVRQDAAPEGEVELTAAEVRFGEAPGWKVDSARLRWAGGRVELDPAEVVLPEGRTAEIAGAWSYSPEALSFRVRSNELNVDEWQAVAERLPGVTLPAWAAAAQGGTLAGELRYEGEEAQPGKWTGDVALTAVTFDVPGLAWPVRIENARALLRGEAFELRSVTARARQLEFGGSFRWRPGETRPASFSLELGPVDAAELERLLKPVLERRRSLLERTLRWRAPPPPPPQWLKERRAEGQVTVEALTLAGVTLENVRARLFWDATTLEFPDLEARWEGAPLTGRLSLRTSGPVPLYAFRGVVDNAPWKNSRFDAELDLRAAGAGAALWSSLRAEALFQARNVELGGDVARVVNGCAELSVERNSPRLRLRCLEVQIGAETLVGAGQSAPDLSLQLDLASPRRTLRLTGALQPLRWEPAAR